jgi:hypothetical protein
MNNEDRRPPVTSAKIGDTVDAEFRRNDGEEETRSARIALHSQRSEEEPAPRRFAFVQPKPLAFAEVSC